MTDGLLCALAVLAVAWTGPVLAEEASGIWTEDSLEASTALAGSSLTASERARSRNWGLTQVEWHRYRQLMQGIRASVSPVTISPVEVLGIHARDAAERRKYAERWAQAMHEDVERILAFQRAYDEAVRRLYPNEPLIDIRRLPEPGRQGDTLGLQDRVLFFTRKDCSGCDDLLDRLLGQLDRIAGIDLYIAGVEEGNGQAIRDWAALRGIDPGLVRSRRITLNFEGGMLQRLTHGQGKTPHMLRRRGDALSELRASEF